MAKAKKAQPRKSQRKLAPGAGLGKARRADREELFILEYLKDQNAARAARAVGYSPDTAKEMGYELLTKPHIKQRVLNAIAEQKVRVKLEADEILLGIKHLAESDPRRLCDLETGCVLPMSKWPDEVAQCVASFEVKELYSTKGKLIGYLKKIKLWDKPKSQENLGRNKGLFKDVVDNNVKAQVAVVDPEEVARVMDEAEKEC